MESMAPSRRNREEAYARHRRLQRGESALARADGIRARSDASGVFIELYVSRIASVETFFPPLTDGIGG